MVHKTFKFVHTLLHSVTIMLHPGNVFDQPKTSVMHHRHLNHEGVTAAAIDDIIARGKRQDWAEFGRAMKADPAIRQTIRRVIAPKLADPYAQRYHVWKHYAG